VSEIEAATGEVINTIKVGSEPFGVSSDGTHVWVTNLKEGTVSEIEAATGNVINTIDVGSESAGVSSDGTHVWVTNSRQGTVSEIEAASGKVINTINIGSKPYGVSSDGTHVWVTSYEEDTVSEIEAASGKVINTIKVGSEPAGVSSDGTDVWVANLIEDTVSEIGGLAPSCTMASGAGHYKRYGEPGFLRLRESLSTNLERWQELNVRYDDDVVHIRLVKLEAASCTGAPGERVFSGTGTADRDRVGGFTLTFTFRETEGGFFFESKLMKGAKEIEANGGPLKQSTEKIS
ncbi:MAG: YncE family protein, partial [Nitrososphaerales archaeon]